MGPTWALHMWVTMMMLGLSERALAVGPEAIPGTRASSLESTPCGGMPCPALMRWGGAWSCLKLLRQALLTSHERLYPLGGLDGRV